MSNNNNLDVELMPRAASATPSTTLSVNTKEEGTWQHKLFHYVHHLSVQGFMVIAMLVDVVFIFIALFSESVNVALVLTTSIFGGQDIGTPFAMFWGLLSPGKEVLPHYHPSPELYIVTDGKGEMMVDGELESVSAGSSIYIPPGAPHSLQNNEEESLRFLVISYDSNLDTQGLSLETLNLN